MEAISFKKSETNAHVENLLKFFFDFLVGKFCVPFSQNLLWKFNSFMLPVWNILTQLFRNYYHGYFKIFAIDYHG